MDYQVSARKYRPGVFDEVVGQPHVVQTLANAIATKRIAHAFLFSGTRGVGKTTVARILAKSLNCEQGPTGTPCNACVNCQEITQGNSVDVIEIDGASNTSVDDVREIRENIKFTPFRGQYRVYIIDEVHMLSNSAFNALLKTLEEPPSHVVFIFATTEIHKIPATILSRCQHYNFRRISKAEIAARLRLVAERDGLQIEDRSLLALARASEGSMRDALSLLDQVVAFGGPSIRHADLEALLGAVPQEMVRQMAEAVLSQQSALALRTIADVLDHGHDIRTYCSDIVEHVRNLLVTTVVPAAELTGLVEGSEEDCRQLQREAARVTPEQLQEALRIFTQAEDALRLSAHPRFVLEAAAIRATRLTAVHEVPAPAPPPSTRGESRPTGAAQQAPLSVRRPSANPLDSSAPPSDRRQPRVDQAPPGARSETVTVARQSESSPSSTRTPQNDSQALRRPVPDEDANPAPAHDSATPSPVAPLATGAGPTLDWQTFQDAVSSEYPNIAPFLEMGRYLGLEGNQVLIGFPKHGTVGRAMLEKPDNVQALGALGERLAGSPIRIRIVDLDETTNGGPTMREVRAAKQAEERMLLFQQARAHPLIKQALELFGGELIEVSPKSLPQEVQE